MSVGLGGLRNEPLASVLMGRTDAGTALLGIVSLPDFEGKGRTKTIASAEISGPVRGE